MSSKLSEFLSRFPSRTPDPSDIDHLLKSLYLGMAFVRNDEQFRLELMEYRHSTMTIETVAWITYEALSINPELTFKRFIEQVAQSRTRTKLQELEK